jgi:uncharacterized protein (TIGR03067 family)
MRTIMLVLAAALLAAAPPTKDENKKDLDRMQGDWAADRFTRDGTALEDDDAQSFFRTVKGDRYTTFRFNRRAGSGKFTLDATRSPRQIDLLPDPPFKGKPIPGIYKIEGDKLTICYAAPGGKRPEAFASKEGSGITLMVWLREKK